MVYLAALYRTTRIARSAEPPPRACSSRSRYCPAMSSVRIRSIRRLRSQQRIGRQPAVEQQFVGPGQAQVAEQDRGAGAEGLRGPQPGAGPVQRGEPAVRGRHAAAGVAGVHDVVVDQRTRLQQLEGCRRAHCRLLVGPAGPPPAPVGERRAQPFASAEQVPERLRDRRQFLADVFQQLLLAAEEVRQDLLDANPQVFGVQRGRRRGGADGHGRRVGASGRAGTSRCAATVT